MSSASTLLLLLCALCALLSAAPVRAMPPLEATFNCAAYTSCDSCQGATVDGPAPKLTDASTAAGGVNVSAPSSSSSLGARVGPCGWCMSSWSCMNGDVAYPTPPLTCAEGWSWESCAAANSCNGLHCNAAQTCKRHTAEDGSHTSFECVTSLTTIIVSSVGSVCVCGLLTACIIGYRRRRAAAQAGFLSSQPYLSETHQAPYYQEEQSYNPYQQQ